ncbi:MAG: DUF1778 domain-containing protein [Candidatus Competibacteraceae bacterium]|nr:DUF1778 domain-containing protein [Candidatus Competibacteraceae bacterium]
MSTSAEMKTPPLNIRIKAEQRSLIEQAAQATNKTVSDFVRDAALQLAQDALLDRTHLVLDEQEWREFIQALDAPPEKKQRLRDLMSRTPVWDNQGQ